MGLVEGAIYCAECVSDELMVEAKAITGLENPKSVPQLSKWLEEQTGAKVDNLRKETVSDMLKGLDAGDVRSVLEMRQELSKTSVKKYAAINNAVCEDGRVRGLLQFYGANRTGRWAGRMVQVQNLPRNYIDSLDIARNLIRAKDVEMLKLIYGNIPDILSQTIRTSFISAGGSVVVSDFSAIEARILAYYAGEQWRLDVFATHGKIYEASASSMFGVPIEKISKGNPEYELRQKGKVAELALGYQGGKGALISMGALNMGLLEEELPEIILRWRAANKRIVDLWYKCENTALSVMSSGMPAAVAGCIFALEGNAFTIELPSKRKLYYPNSSLAEGAFNKPALYYWGVDQHTKQWGKISTYGGKLVENITQAIARDCLAVALTRVDAAGYKIVMHVHDEIVTEGGSLEQMNEILGQPIEWAPCLILQGAGFENTYYKKD